MRTRRISSSGRTTPLRGYVPRGGPGLSLVLAIQEPKPELEASIAAVVAPCVRTNIDLVIACNAPRRVLDALRRRHSGARFSAVEGLATLPELRSVAMRDATGEIIVILDDTATAATATRAGALLVAGLDQMATRYAADARSIPWGALLGRLMAGVGPAAAASAPGGTVNGMPVAPTSQAAGD